MPRKIACCLTVVATACLMVLRIVNEMMPQISLAGLPLADFLIVFTLVSMACAAILGFSKKAPVVLLEDAPQPLFGWFTTLCGALLVMSVVLDVFCWTVYGKTPPPNAAVVNQADLYTLIFSLIFGIVSGLFLITRGFCWMSKSNVNRTAMDWLALSPVVWMWLRLARYEISNASTIDLSVSFFDLAALVTGSLFFLQFARLLTGIGKPPRNMLFIFSLFAAIGSLSSLPYAVYQLINGISIESMLIVIVDAMFGLLALSVAFIQAFTRQTEDNAQPIALPQEDAPTATDEDGMAWVTPEKERQPLDPPFSIDDKLPILSDIVENEEPVQEPVQKSIQDTVVEEVEADVEMPDEAPTPSSDWTVDDILAELNKE